ncbi:ABC transporter permease [Clostridia bacterium]|nr:ABC transporter permease [Clostridia bacterium]
MRYLRPKSRMAILLEGLRGRRALYLAGLIAVIFTNLLDFVAPQVVRFTVDSVLSGIAPAEWLAPYIEKIGGMDFLRSNLWICGVVAAAAALLSAIFGFCRRYFTLSSAEYMVKSVRDRLYGHIQRLPFNWHVKAQTGDIIQRCTSDVDVVRNTAANIVPDFARSIVMILATSAIMLSMDPLMTLFAMCLIPLFVVTGVFYNRVVSKMFQIKDESEGALQSVVQENLSGVRVVRAFGRERFEIDRFGKSNADFFGKSIKMGVTLAAFWAFSDLIATFQLVLVFAAGAFRVLGGTLTIGTFLVFFTYTMMLMWPARATGRQISEMAKCSISLKRIKEILDAEPEGGKASDTAPDMNADVAFEHVTFEYDDGIPVLRDVSFTVSRGETLGVLGGTGSGKSTLAYLLTRLYDLPEGSEGRVTIGGVDTRTIPRERVRKNVAMVLQEPFLYSKTVGENIRGSMEQADASMMENAARIALIHDTLSELEKGYDTKVGERGVTLSGGQKQRVAIARMLLQNAPIMIFDDSLSAVDTQTDAKIRNALREHTSDATVILISHRISTLMHASKILVLKDGAVEALGTHEELLQGENTYRRVYDLQRAVTQEGAPLNGRV